MYDRKAQFVRATARGDHDFAAFGQCVILPELRRERDGLLYRCFHIRDTVWCENSEAVIDTVHRTWKVEARELVRLFRDKVAAQVRDCLKDEPYKLIKCRHIVLPADQYDSNYDGDRKTARFPFRSIYVDVENDTILEEIGVPANDYVIPRWGIWPDTQYGMSPAVVVALPDARMLQQVGLTLLEAGQKAVDPPWKAVGGEVIGGPGVNMQAGGVTWVDPDYDETTGKALEQFPIDTRGLNFGVAVQQKAEAMIAEAFYLNKINLPDIHPQMTATEVQHRVQQYIRQALPLFEPMESEYNGGLCDKTFELGMRLGAFGSPHDIPDVLRGRDVRFQFDSPLQSATERAKATTFAEAQQLLGSAMQFDPSARHEFRLNKALRDAFLGIGTPIDWLVPEEEAERIKAAERDQQARLAQVQSQLDAGAAVADVAERAGRAAQEINAAQAAREGVAA